MRKLTAEPTILYDSENRMEEIFFKIEVRSFFEYLLRLSLIFIGRARVLSIGLQNDILMRKGITR